MTVIATAASPIHVDTARSMPPCMVPSRARSTASCCNSAAVRALLVDNSCNSMSLASILALLSPICKALERAITVFVPTNTVLNTKYPAERDAMVTASIFQFFIMAVRIVMRPIRGPELPSAISDSII